jgi:hypothetical protein
MRAEAASFGNSGAGQSVFVGGLKNRHLAAPMLLLQNGLLCTRQPTKAERVGDAHSGGSVSVLPHHPLSLTVMMLIDVA